MARMFPKKLRPETKSNAERRLYRAFRRDLPDDFYVFHSVRWLIRDPRSGAKDGEADFVVAHPELGILVLEVKGGTIRYDGETDRWYSNDIPIKNPVNQAVESKYSLLEKLKDLPEWQNRWLTLGHAVAFPDVSVKRNLLPDLPAVLVLDAPALADLEGWVRQALDYWHANDQKVGGVGKHGMEVLQELLCPTRTLRPPLRFVLEQEEEEIQNLTEEQIVLLDALRGQRRALIVGCAGSGKTTLALEQARRLDSQGFQVLLTCFNRPLADHLRRADLPGTVYVQNFHRLVSALVDEAGLRGELDERSCGLDEDTFYVEVFPEFLSKAAEVLGPRYDALIVDEGQDFYEEWFLALAMLLHDPDNGIVYIFKDDNQNLFRPRFGLPWDLHPFFLTRNCRNTRHIHRAVLRFYRADYEPQAIGPDGIPPEVYFYRDEDQFNEHIRRLLHRFLVEERLGNDSLVLLSPRRRGWLNTGKQYGNFVLTERWPPAGSEVFWTTVQSFKGLESPVVILAGLEEEVYPDLTTVTYVGMSRARNRLVVLAVDSLPDDVKAALQG
ncbi:MAG TPA: hypothetical protein EYP52_01925 [Anaerolineae bacterium]|nr:hypothetical protein [Anaerolineae bacterium]